jgi:hypothetical protein
MLVTISLPSGSRYLKLQLGIRIGVLGIRGRRQHFGSFVEKMEYGLEGLTGFQAKLGSSGGLRHAINWVERQICKHNRSSSGVLGIYFEL